MPNWCVNHLDITGSEEDIVALREAVRVPADGDNDARIFSFAKIVPIPSDPIYHAQETQNHFQCGCQSESVELTDQPKSKVGTDFDGNPIMRHPTQQQVNGVPVERIMTEATNIRTLVDAQFGGTEVCPEHKVPRINHHDNWWYNWNAANWGTKWNAGDVWCDREDEEPEDGAIRYSFETAWSPSIPVSRALSKMFPNLTIIHRYCEGGGGYAGEFVFQRGVEVVPPQEFSFDELPDGAWILDEEGKNTWERDYDKVPMTEFESFCDEHFGGVVGG